MKPFPPPEKKALWNRVLDEILEERVASSRGRIEPRGVKRKMSNYPLRPRERRPTLWLEFENCPQIVK